MEKNNNNVVDEVVDLEEKTQEEKSSVVISPDVVSSIAGVSANEVEGVFGMYQGIAGGIAEILGRKNNNRGIKVEITDNTCVIDLYVIVNYGYRIPNVATEIQENVKNNVETMTGLDVTKVNVHIDGVSFKKHEEEEAKRQQEQEEENIGETVIEETEILDVPNEEEID